MNTGLNSDVQASGIKVDEKVPKNNGERTKPGDKREPAGEFFCISAREQ